MPGLPDSLRHLCASFTARCHEIQYGSAMEAARRPQANFTPYNSSSKLLLARDKRWSMPRQHLDLRMAVGDDGSGQAGRSQGKHQLLRTRDVTSMRCKEYGAEDQELTAQ